ncbi:unnamed protein product [Rotaria socialis]|uniref:G protein-activated inward rectifier potassium channel 3 n=2 Tax=Rotaria socialis TaxID=392032 RepID=A0A818M5B3_9BILA|nr:unnamed protein product [Rotaria socialis]CAF4466043.1 unnamed protein product [Rotaria socialis]
MSYPSHLTVAATSETKTDKSHTNFNRPAAPSDDSSNLPQLPSSPRTNSKYLYYVNAEPTQKQSITPTPSPLVVAPTPSPTLATQSTLTSHGRRKLSAISLTVPWYKRTRVPSDEKLSQKTHKMSRDRLLPLDKLFNSDLHRPSDEDQASPLNDLTAFDETVKSNEKNIRSAKENGYLHNSSHLMTRLQYTTKGTKALRLLGDGSRQKNRDAQQDQTYNPKESVLSKISPRGTSQRRLLLKNGDVNISRFNIEKRRRQYLADIFTTLIDLKWRYTLCLFTLGFCLSWLAFALIWYLLMYTYGDFHPDNYNSANYSVCIAGVHSFAGAILFSIETQQTIGYGTRVVKETCYLAIVVMMVQSSIGVLLQSFMVGVVFAKISRPKKRTETLIWSREAVICLRDGQMTLQCRVGDMRKSHIVEAHVRMYLIRKRVTLEGEILPLHTHDMNVGFDKGVDRLFLIWPLVIEHIIDAQSPLYTMSRDDLVQQRFELVVILEGIIESTGMTTQARTSYLPSEIVWGYRFERLITFQRNDGLYRIDYSRFHLTYPVDMITCSAKELNELHELEKWHENNQNNTNTHSDNNSNMREDEHQNERSNDNENGFFQEDKAPQQSPSLIWHEKKESTL